MILNHDRRFQENPPIVVGGVGGSGTRVVAEILIKSNIFLGRDLNQSFDNLLFSFFFKHQKFNQINQYDIGRDLDELFILHEKMFRGKSISSIKELALIINSGLAHYEGPFYGRRWIVRRILGMVSPRKTIYSDRNWGWKEPYSMFFMKELRKAYPRCKFILLVRNGFDMAFSKSDQQYRYWNSPLPMSDGKVYARRRFDFWYRCNKRAIDLGAKYFGPDFLLLKIEDLCLDPRKHVLQILTLAGQSQPSVPDEVLSLPKMPSSQGRYKNYDTDWINNEVQGLSAEIGY